MQGQQTGTPVAGKVNLRFTFDAMPYDYNEDKTIGQFTVDAAVEREYAESNTLPNWIMIVVMRAMWERQTALFEAWDKWRDLPYVERYKTPPPQPETGEWSVGFRFYHGNNVNQWNYRGQLHVSPRPNPEQKDGQPFVRNIRFKVLFPNGKAFMVSGGNIEEVSFSGS